MAARSGHQDVACIARADIGEAVDGSSWNLHACTWPHDLGRIPDEILQSSFDHHEDFVFSGGDMCWCTEARFDRHVEHRKRAWIRVDDFGGYSCEFGCFEFRSDVR